MHMTRGNEEAGEVWEEYAIAVESMPMIDDPVRLAQVRSRQP